jgi:DNA-binding XRE family transcriptional regulator
MSTLKVLRIELGWSVARLATEAKVSRQTITAAERGSAIQAEPAKAIAEALSRGYGRNIRVFDIEGLVVL